MRTKMEKLILVKTLAELKELEQYLSDKEYIAYDCETTGLDKEHEMIGYSFCAELDLAYYVILAEWDVTQQKLNYLETVAGTQILLSSLIGKSLIMHNAVFDCWKAETCFGVKLMPSLHTDTMILAQLLNENRRVGLKELAVSIYGEDSRKEQAEMKESVTKNGGVLTRDRYELYKADADLIGKYGAKDTILTLKLFYELVPELFKQGLDAFFYEDESMPLLRGPTYDLNTTGLRVDAEALQTLRSTLETECMQAKSFIHKEIQPNVKEKYQATTLGNTFNIEANAQLVWLLFLQLGNEFGTLTKGGKELCKSLSMKVPYSPAAKKEFIQYCIEHKGIVYEEPKFNLKTQKMGLPKKIRDPIYYIACGKESLDRYSKKYKWVEKLLEYKKNTKLLNTYVDGIQERAKYNVIRPSFLQHGTTSGRYSSRNPNFQNLPKGDKRIKSCIVARPGNVFVGADYSQLEPRVFASFSKDERLMKCFADGDDFYSVIGVEVFDKKGLSLKKDDEGSFAKKYPVLRDISKVVGLSATYGTTAFKMAPAIGKSVDEAQQVIDSYFMNFPSVQSFMLSCHEEVKTNGEVKSLFGRPRRMPEALEITGIYGNAEHGELPYTVRNILNLAVNHTIQSTGASIMNRAAIKLYDMCRRAEQLDPRWSNVKIVLQVHDEVILEGPNELVNEMSAALKYSMENTVELPGVELVAIPKLGKSLSELK